MAISFQSLFQALVLITLLLAPERLVAQSPAAATAPPPRVPELAELIPLATAVSGRLASLERAIADGVALSRVEQQLRDISARVDEYAAQFRGAADRNWPAGGPTSATQSGDQECGRCPDRGQQSRDGQRCGPSGP